LVKEKHTRKQHKTRVTPPPFAFRLSSSRGLLYLLPLNFYFSPFCTAHPTPPKPQLHDYVVLVLYSRSSRPEPLALDWALAPFSKLVEVEAPVLDKGVEGCDVLENSVCVERSEENQLKPCSSKSVAGVGWVKQPVVEVHGRL